MSDITESFRNVFISQKNSGYLFELIITKILQNDPHFKQYIINYIDIYKSNIIDLQSFIFEDNFAKIYTEMKSSGSIDLEEILIALYGSLLVFATSLFCWDIPESNPEFYSDYGFLNTIEYIQFELTVSVVGLIVFSIVSVKIFHIDDIPLSIYFILFGVLIYYISDLVEFGLGTYFLENTQIHSDFLDVFIPVRFYTSKIFILLGLVWKN